MENDSESVLRLFELLDELTVRRRNKSKQYKQNVTGLIIDIHLTHCIEKLIESRRRSTIIYL